jgi:hypothetical protein
MSNRWKKAWNTISQLAVWVVSIITTFVLPPILDTPESENSVWKLTQFLITLLLILLILLARYLNRSSHLFIWLLLGLLFLGAGLFSLNSYDNIRRKCSCKYYSSTILIGTVVKDSVDRDRDCESLVKSVAGRVNDIWTEESINSCRKREMYYYISIVPFFTVVMISFLQALFLSKRKTPGKPHF